jgi:hypothetical protein
LRKIAGAIVKIAPPVGQVSPEAEQAVKQFVSEGLSAGDVIDVFDLTGETRPELSILSDEFLDKLAKGLKQPALGVEILKKILSDEIRVRSRTNRMQAKLFSDQLQAVLDRYEARQITSGEVIERLIELAKKLRDARRRHQALDLSVEESGVLRRACRKLRRLDSRSQTGGDRTSSRPRDQGRPLGGLGRSRGDRSRNPREDQALLRRYKFEAPKGGGHSVDRVVDVLLDQARELYRFWPDVPLAELPI